MIQAPRRVELVDAEGMEGAGGPYEDEEDFEGRPFGARPFGARPFGARPFGARPFGARPFGARPFGARPFGARPFGARAGGGGGGLDPNEWAIDIAELFCEHSAVVRLGGTLVVGDGDAQIGCLDPEVAYRAGGRAPNPGQATVDTLRPGAFTLSARVTLPDGFLRPGAWSSELSGALKLDLAESLARGADEAFLGPRKRGRPDGLAKVAAEEGTGIGDLLERVWTVASTVAARAALQAPGWILHPATATALANTRTTTGLVGSDAEGARSIATYPGLLDAVGGTLLGLPLVVSEAANQDQRRMYFSADWSEAWIAFGREPVAIGLSVDRGAPGETLITASISHDFKLRKRTPFAWAQG